MCQFAKGIGNDLHHARLEGHVDLLPRRQPLADDVVFVGKRRPNARPLPRGRRLRQVLPHVRHARVLIPRQRVPRQRLAQPVVVEPRPPFALREEWVDADAREQPQFAILDRPAQVEPGALLVAFLPLRLVVFFEEVHVADPAGRAAGLPAAEEALCAAAEILPVPPERTAAERAVWIAGIGERAAVQAEVVLAHVADEPGVKVAAGGPAETEEVGPVVEQRRAAAGTALTQVVDVEIPVDAVRRPPDTKHLEGIPTGEQLRAEDTVVLDLRVIDIEGRLLCVGRHHRPPEHRHAAERERVATAGDELLVLDHRLAGDGIDRPLAAGPRQRHLLVVELEFTGAELPARHSQAARCEARLLGDEAAAVDLPEHVGPQSHHAGIVVDRGEHRGPGDHAARPRHVVEHAHRLDDPLSLAEDDVPLHVEFQWHIAGLGGVAFEVGLRLTAGPDHETVGGDIEWAGRIDAVHDEVHTRRDHRHPLVARRTGEPADVERHARPREGPQPSGGRGGVHLRHRSRAEFAELRPLDRFLGRGIGLGVGVVRDRHDTVGGRIVDRRRARCGHDAGKLEGRLSLHPEAAGPTRTADGRRGGIGSGGS